MIEPFYSFSKSNKNILFFQPYHFVIEILFLNTHESVHRSKKNLFLIVLKAFKTSIICCCNASFVLNFSIFLFICFLDVMLILRKFISLKDFTVFSPNNFVFRKLEIFSNFFLPNSSVDLISYFVYTAIEKLRIDSIMHVNYLFNFLQLLFVSNFYITVFWVLIYY